MAASVQVEDLQSRLKQSLSELGYSGKVAKLPAALVGNEKMTKFMSWLIDSLTSENHLTSAEIAKLVKLLVLRFTVDNFSSYIFTCPHFSTNLSITKL